MAGGDGLHRRRKAALELTEQGTRLDDAASGVIHQARANAAKHYDDQLAALVCLIAVINIGGHLRILAEGPRASILAQSSVISALVNPVV